MKKMVVCLLLCTLYLAGGLDRAHAMMPEAEQPSLPVIPFAQNVETGKIVYLGMNKEDAEAIIGNYIEEYMFAKNTFIYEGVTLGYRDDLVVYIEIHCDDLRWAANGVVLSGMPTAQALEILELPFEAENHPFSICYFDDGIQIQGDRNTYSEREDGRRDYLWALTVFADRHTLGMITMGDMQYLMRRE